MLIETYFGEVRTIIDDCPEVQSSNITYDKRSTYEGFIRGEVYFVHDSVLHLREYVDVETNRDRLTYVYQYMDSQQRMVFRYDNTGHHQRLNLSTFPHHKHDGSEDNVADSRAPTLLEIVNEIGTHVKLF